MTVAYRADTGTLLADFVTGAQSISFPGTLPQVDDIVVAGGVMYAAATRTSTITDNRNSPYTIDVRKYTVAASDTSEATIASVKVAVSASPYTVSFDTTVASSYYVVGAIAFSGVNTTTRLDVTASANAENINKSSQVTGTTAAIANTDSVAVIALAVDCSGDLSTLTDAGYTIPIKETNGSLHAVGGLGYKVGLSAGTQAETWTYGVSSGAATDDHAAGIAVYKGGSVGVNNVTPRKFYNAQTGIVVAGVLFGAAQGSGKVWISPTDNVSDGSRVEQTVTAWADTSVTITSVRGALNMATTLYLFVVENGGTSNTPGYPVEFITSASLAWTKG